MSRTKKQLYPDYSAFVDAIDAGGITPELLRKIINKHRDNAKCNEELYGRYMTLQESVPIFGREPRYEDDENPINNKINHDHFGEIVDFKTGYFAGAPASYGYSKTEEAEETTGGEQAVEAARKVLTDFTVRNNMHGVDIETTKRASIYGYVGRLFYIDEEGTERVMAVHGYQTIVLSKTNLAEPKYAIRYYQTTDINDKKEWVVEFYDNTYIRTFRGGLLSRLAEDESKYKGGKPQLHMFDYCPLQIIANNDELLGDAEKVLAEIDDYDKNYSDNSNEIESFAHAYMVFEGLRVDDATIKEGQKTGAFKIPATGTQQGKIYYLTKNINDAFTEHHLQRLDVNIHQGSNTPNLKDAAFGTASGIALKFKILGLETKCGICEAKKRDADMHMWRVLASSWKKKRIAFDPLQATVDYKRNFPIDSLSEAQTAQARISAGLPKEWVFSQMEEIDDANYIMEMIEAEKEDVANMYPDNTPPQDDEDKNEEENDKKQVG